MGEIKKPTGKKLIISFIYKDKEILNNVEILLIRKFGSIDSKSRELAFNHTKYYEKEIGSNLKRAFISFKRLIGVEKIWRIKIFTNKLEMKFPNYNRRAINIDPGYISLGKLVLLTTKDYSHRLYLGGGIFGEVTLLFKHGSFRPLEYTYPDYRTKAYIHFFNSVRNEYKLQLAL